MVFAPAIIPSLIFLILIIAQFKYSSSYTFSGYVLTDLEGTNLGSFSSEASSWSVSSMVGPNKYNLCGTTYFLGGENILGNLTSSYGHYFRRYYSSLPSHDMIYFSMTFIAIDGWSSNSLDSFQLQFGSRIVTGWVLDSASFNSNICGATNKVLYSLRIYGRVHHDKSFLDFRVVSLIGGLSVSSVKSFGFRDINFLFVKTTVPTTDHVCGRATGLTFSVNQCPCSHGQYEINYLGSNTCGSCHNNCNGCFGPSEKDCINCQPGSTFNGYACITSCHSYCSASIYNCFGESVDECLICNPGYFLTNNKTCLSSCPSPLTKTSDGINDFCESPCNTTAFLYPNQTCIATCKSPLQQSTVSVFKLCLSPCSSTQFLYPNGTCRASCNSPWQPRYEGGLQFCDYACTGNDFLYWNGACKPDCDFPLQQRYEGSFRLCKHSCAANQYLHVNGSCRNDCQFPLQSKEEDGLSYCTYPCKDSDYLYWNGSCLSTCLMPLRAKVINNKRQCVPPCQSPPEYYYEEIDDCRPVCNQTNQTIWVDSFQMYRKCLPKKEEIVNIAVTDVVVSDTLTLFGIIKPLQYIRYLDISGPKALRDFMKSRGRTFFSLRFGSRMTEDSQKDFTKHSLPAAFENSGMHSSFLVNYWEEITSFGFLLAITYIAIFMEKLSEKVGWSKTKTVFERIKVVLKWNTFIIFVGTGLGDTLLFASIEFRTLLFDSFSSVLSFFICLFAIGINIAFVVDILHLIPRVHTQKLKVIENNSYYPYVNFLTKWEGYQVLFRGFMDDAPHKVYFFLIYIIRITVPMLIASLFSDLPQMQTILYFLIGIGFMWYLHYARPIKKSINHYQLLALELVLLIINFSLIVVTILDAVGVSSGAGAIFFGNVVIMGNLCVNILLIVFLGIKVLMGIRIAMQLLHVNEISLSRATAIQMLYLPVQQSGMGFEQVQLVRFMDEDEDENENENSSNQEQEQKKGLKKKLPNKSDGVKKVKKKIVYDRNEKLLLDEIGNEVEVIRDKTD